MFVLLPTCKERGIILLVRFLNGDYYFPNLFLICGIGIVTNPGKTQECMHNSEENQFKQYFIRQRSVHGKSVYKAKVQTSVGQGQNTKLVKTI